MTTDELLSRREAIAAELAETGAVSAAAALRDAGSGASVPTELWAEIHAAIRQLEGDGSIPNSTGAKMSALRGQIKAELRRTGFLLRDD